MLNKPTFTFTVAAIILTLVWQGCTSRPSLPMCNLSPEQPPELRGLRLGMQQTDLKAKYREASDWSGEIFTISIDGIHKVSQREEFRGLSKISYSTTSNQISELVFEYETIDRSE